VHSTLTSKGQTTIPKEIRAFFNLHPGDRLLYSVEGDAVMLRPHPGAGALKGALASDKGKELSFAQIRAAAARRATQ
jgi:AbrB family looped-hinge helix DNA binding protein